MIVSPALADANNGNWRTAERWQRLLAAGRPVRITRHWPDGAAAGDALMLALHARRSAPAIAAWAERHPGRGLAVVLTGTDLYQDLASDAQAQASLALAQRLVVLQERAVQALPAQHRAQARVVVQSAPARTPLPKAAQQLDCVMVGHLRAAKDPRTLFAAARLLRDRADIRIAHVGDGGADPVLAQEARATQDACPGYRWLGPLPHAQALEQISCAHLLVHTSAMEGGANVLVEAVRCGTPVAASDIPGNVGLLGPDYAGYFPVGDAAALAGLLAACRDTQQDPASGLLARLRAQCALQAPRFDEGRERAALEELLQELETRP